MAHIPKHLINSKYELHQFIRNARTKAFPQFEENGHDLKCDTLIVHQVYDSGHTISLICEGQAPNRRCDVIFNIDEEDIKGLGRFRIFILPERIGFLDAYYEPIQEAVGKELRAFLNQGLSKKLEEERKTTND